MKTKPIPNPDKPPSSEAGYTIIEGIIAILVVTILMVAVTPMVVFSAATRMQAKRIQLASQAARSYLTAVKADPDQNAPNLNNFQADSNDPLEAPDSNQTLDDCTDGYCDGKQLYCVSFDEEAGCQNDSPVDMVVQPIITDPYSIPNGSSEPDLSKGYGLAIRVYRASAFGGNTPELKGDERGEESEDKVVNFLGRSDLPLLQTKTAIPPKGSRSEQYNTFCEVLGGCGDN